ncbi:disease resistance protein RUN1-like [Mercurialis annua]|uniref:disease resistance protein RUN1-like n=1 Tax=Mercurialis annua TaxID=3986 RepID=UPI0024AF85E9|nr:disease resistance protein RUN1-like [Mercurialis annua]
MAKQNLSSHNLHTCSSNYHAFLSFTDEDINFLNQLLKQLTLKGILTNGIEEARFLVVILSETYVSSAGCLDQLVRIVDRWEINTEQVLVPIFYKLDPSDLKDQMGIVANVFAVHQMEETVKVQRWRDALTKVASVCGWDSRHWEDKVLVKEIVRDISDRLIYGLSKDTGYLVGICSHIKEMEKTLCCNSNVAHMVGIWGMGGIGKTTIANVIYDMLSSKFEVRCFLENVKENFKKHGAASLQQKLLSIISFGKRNFTTGAYNVGVSVIKRMFSRTKLLLVLDDVDDWRQLEALAGEPNWFGSGSKIIITTRDKHLLHAHGVTDIYEVKCLQTDAALQLFSQYAFRQKNPKMEYLELSTRLVSYAQCLPLALKVLGSFLYETSIIEWQKVQGKLEIIPDLRIHDVLKVSFDGLDDLQREIFLDIACFFNGELREVVRNTLEACGFFPDIAFAILKDKALITTEDDMKLRMHDLLQEMGHDIVRQESEEPGKRSRLWIPEDIYHVLTKNTGTRSVEAISLDMSKSRDMHLEGNEFAGMGRLRLLNFYVSNPISKQKKLDDNKVHFHQGLQYFSSELRYLQWHKFPSKSLPLNFNPENLVKLKLFDSKVKELWAGVQSLVNLKEIDLAGCEYLTAIPDLSNAKSIKTIDLNRCKSLIEVPSSIQQLNNLEKINLAHCESLISLPDRIDSKFLREATFTHCSKLKKCPEIFGNLEELDLSYTGISDLPKSIQELKILKFLDLQGCSNITKFPNVSPNTKILYLKQNAIEEVPSSIQFLTGLVTLKISENIKLSSLPSSIWKLKSLELLDLSGCSKLENFPEILEPIKLSELYLRGTAVKELPSTIEHLKSLSKLLLYNCKRLVSLPCNIRKLSKLHLIDLRYCIKLCSLPQFPESLKILAADQCESLKTLSTKCKCCLNSLHFVNCFNLNCKEDLQLAIRLMASKAIRSKAETKILFPGKEIPKWFRDQSTGSSVTTKLPLSWNVLKGISVCVVFELGDPPSLEDFSTGFDVNALLLELKEAAKMKM